MLLSMTGHGEAHRRHEKVAVAIEVRTINSRYFKLTLRTSESYNSLESSIEEVVRQRIRRGTLQVNLRVDRQPSPADFQISDVVLGSYHKQLRLLSEEIGLSESVRLDALLTLPGVVLDRSTLRRDAEQDWPLIEATLREALDNLASMRVDEGRAMEVDLQANCLTTARQLDAIVARAPMVVDAYRLRLTERLNKLLAEVGVSITAADVVREVGMFAERSDIAEETVRLKSHLEQFDTIMRNEE